MDLMDHAFAMSERTAAQQIPVHLTRLVDSFRPVGISAQAQRLEELKVTKIALVNEIMQASERIFGLTASSATQAEKAKEAAEKAKTWSIVGAVFAVIVAVVIAVIAVVTSVFTFGAGTGAGIALIIGAIQAATVATAASIGSFMNVAVRTGHPLAGEFGSATNKVAAALKKFLTSTRQDPETASVALRDILKAVREIEKLTIAAGNLPGPCTGDPQAVFECCKEMGPLLSNMGQIVQTMRLLHDDDTRVTFRVLLRAHAVVTSVRTPLIRPRT